MGSGSFSTVCEDKIVVYVSNEREKARTLSESVPRTFDGDRTNSLVQFRQKYKTPYINLFDYRWFPRKGMRSCYHLSYTSSYLSFALFTSYQDLDQYSWDGRSWHIIPLLLAIQEHFFMVRCNK